MCIMTVDVTLTAPQFCLVVFFSLFLMYDIYLNLLVVADEVSGYVILGGQYLTCCC
jgi:hypothetical protein